MVAVIYEDSDRAQPKRYATLAVALSQRGRNADVVAVFRSNIIPGHAYPFVLIRSDIVCNVDTFRADGNRVHCVIPQS
jgi:hypothetical protein